MINEHHDIKIPEEESTFKLLMYFLENGHLPSWSSKLTVQEFMVKIETLVSDKKNAALVKLVWPLVEEENVRNRMQWQLSVDALEEIFLCLHDILPGALEDLKEDCLSIYALGNRNYDIGEFRAMLKGALVAVLARSIESRWDEVFAAYFLEKCKERNPYILEDMERNNTRLNSTAFIPVIENMKLHDSFKKKGVVYEREILKKYQQHSVSSNKESSKELNIQNAGLVILSPFLPVLFQKLNVASNEKLLDAARAIAILHFLESGTDEYAEYETMLSKLLCGIPDALAIDTNIKLTNSEKRQSELMLTSVIQYWKSLKDTSVEGLRQSFLQRDGKLVLGSNEWQLHVEKEGNDDLLYQLPWSINRIKLPWMKKAIETKWL